MTLLGCGQRFQGHDEDARAALGLAGLGREGLKTRKPPCPGADLARLPSVRMRLEPTWGEMELMHGLNGRQMHQRE